MNIYPRKSIAKVRDHIFALNLKICMFNVRGECFAHSDNLEIVYFFDIFRPSGRVNVSDLASKFVRSSETVDVVR